ncbi:hypothetical protein ACFWOJ_34770 [Streptomyces sp. NPDC058439]|uniref:hypothetical protein n=1 Tax=Streptomyces sp. NPDC058439 TaxID=3346500 RepID=UPI0036668670
MAISTYRQQMIPGGVVHGIVTNGGDAPNVIPARTEASYDCRAETLKGRCHVVEGIGAWRGVGTCWGLFRHQPGWLAEPFIR